VSGGAGFGTWFAYGAAYSNSGYVLADPSGVRHIFVCMVSDRYVVKDDCVMRVVGQGCAYPLWLLTYMLQQQPVPVAPQVAAPVPAASVAARRKCQATPQKFFVVRNGAWVAEAVTSDGQRPPRPQAKVSGRL